MKMKTSEVEELQKAWGEKPCNHGVGYGHEVDDETGCDYDCFCLQCGRRHTNPEIFKKSE